jgi:hypothetical protein
LAGLVGCTDSNYRQQVVAANGRLIVTAAAVAASTSTVEIAAWACGLVVCRHCWPGIMDSNIMHDAAQVCMAVALCCLHVCGLTPANKVFECVNQCCMLRSCVALQTRQVPCGTCRQTEGDSGGVDALKLAARPASQLQSAKKRSHLKAGTPALGSSPLLAWARQHCARALGARTDGMRAKCRADPCANRLLVKLPCGLPA